MTELLGSDVDINGVITAVVGAHNGRHDDNSINALWDESLEEHLEINSTKSAGMEAAMDPGATANVAHPRHMPGNINIRPNTTDFHFKGANDSRIKTYGDCDTILIGEDMKMTHLWGATGTWPKLADRYIILQ